MERESSLKGLKVDSFIPPVDTISKKSLSHTDFVQFH